MPHVASLEPCSARGRGNDLPSAALHMKRMDRKEFFGKLAPLDEERLRKALWNLYWRGSAAMRQRIEAELDPEVPGHRQRTANRVVDPDSVLSEVQEFVALARSGAYMAGDRRMSRQERSRWRFTFQRLSPTPGRLCPAPRASRSELPRSSS